MFKNDQKIQLLLDHSDSIEFNAQENDGETAFIAACKYGLLRVVELLKREKFKAQFVQLPFTPEFSSQASSTNRCRVWLNWPC